MGHRAMTQPAFYARTGSPLGDLRTLLHLPYTVWHLSYVVIGAAIAPSVDAVILAGTVLAFAAGLGVGAHALDELHDRPLGTRLSHSVLRILGWGGLAVGGGMAVIASFVISPIAIVWGAAGILLAAAYALEWSRIVHSLAGFGLAWGAFPVLVGNWAQTETVDAAAVAMAGVATITAVTQRVLSTPARRIRRGTVETGEWDPSDLLATWERPLRLLVLAHVALAAALLVH